MIIFCRNMHIYKAKSQTDRRTDGQLVSQLVLCNFYRPQLEFSFYYKINCISLLFFFRISFLVKYVYVQMHFFRYLCIGHVLKEMRLSGNLYAYTLAFFSSFTYKQLQLLFFCSKKEKNLRLLVLNFNFSVLDFFKEILQKIA